MSRRPRRAKLASGAASVLLIVTVSAGCAVLRPSSGLTVAIPRPPDLAAEPLKRACTVGQGDRERETTCVTVLESDWSAIDRYARSLQEELESLCVKVGQVTLPSAYRTDPAAKAEADRRVEAACWEPAR